MTQRIHARSTVVPGLETLALQRLGRSTDFQESSVVGDNEIFASRSRTAESIARATLRYRPDTGLTLEAGAEGAYNLLDGSSSYVVNGTAVPLPSADARVDADVDQAAARPDRQQSCARVQIGHGRSIRGPSTAR